MRRLLVSSNGSQRRSRRTRATRTANTVVVATTKITWTSMVGFSSIAGKGPVIWVVEHEH